MFAKSSGLLLQVDLVSDLVYLHCCFVGNERQRFEHHCQRPFKGHWLHIDREGNKTVSGSRDLWFNPQLHQCVVSLSMTFYPI